MNTPESPYGGFKLEKLCEDLGYPRILKESDWELRKRVFLKTYANTPPVAIEILLGTDFKNFISTDQKILIKLYAGKNDEHIGKDRLKKFVQELEDDPIILRKNELSRLRSLRCEIKIDREIFFSEQKDWPTRFMSIIQQDWRSLMIRTLDLSKVKLLSIPTFMDNTHGVTKENVDCKRQLKLLNKPGKIALDFGIAIFLDENQDVIPEAWEGKQIYFPGSIYCHRPTTNLHEPISMVYISKSGEKWSYSYSNMHVVGPHCVFAYLDEEDRAPNDIVNGSFYYKQ
jgi:hypothetical protein